MRTTSLAANFPQGPRAVTIALLFSALSAPFLLRYHHYPIPSFYQDWLAILLALAVSFELAINHKNTSFSIPSSVWIPLCLIPSIVISLLWGNHAHIQGHLFHLIWILAAVIMMITGHALATRHPFIPLATTIASALLFGALVSTVVAWGLRLGPGLFFPGYWPAEWGFLAQRNHNGLHLWLGLLGACHLFMAGKISRLFFGIGVFILADSALMSSSRSVYLYATVTLAISAWAAYQAEDKKDRRTLLLVGIAPLFFLIASLLLRTLWQAVDLAGGGFDGGAVARFTPQTVAGDGRITLWYMAMQIIGNHPWFGVGPGGYLRASWHLGDTLPTGMRVELPSTHAHNLFLQLAAELGVPTTLLFAGLLALWLLAAVRKASQPAHWLFVMVPLAILTHNQVEFTLWYLFFLIPAALCIGAVSPSIDSLRFPAHTLLLVALTCLGIGLSLGRDYQKLERLTAYPVTDKHAMADLLRKAEHPLFGAYASTTIMETLPSDGQWLSLQLLHGERAMNVVPFSKSGMSRFESALTTAGQGEIAAHERSVRQLSGN